MIEGETVTVTNILVLSDIRLYREGLKTLLEMDGRFNPVETAANRDEAISCLLRAKPAAILLDLAMQNGPSLLQSLAQEHRETPVIVLAVPDSEAQVLACAEAGAAGFVTRDASVPVLIHAIETALKGELNCSPRLAARLFRRLSMLAAGGGRPCTPLAVLTVRQTEILKLIEKGQSNKEIARVLGIEIATVKNHVHAILDRLEVNCRGEAAALLRRSGNNGESQRTYSVSDNPP